MADRIELAFRRAARCLLRPDTSVLVAVSGGSDSVALLHLLVGMSRGHPLTLVVAHLDHALRRGSRADRLFVERLAGRLQLDCLAERRPVGELRRRDESPEEAARRVRRQFLIEAARRVGAERIATGHTLDDQAETVLMRLVRGAGPRALSGMAPSGPGPFVRPLLGIERAELAGFLKRRGLDFREDPSNRDQRFDRNRVRRLVVPMLAKTLNPRAPRHIVAAAERLRADADCLDSIALREFERLAGTGRGGVLVLPARDLAALEPPVARRVAALALRNAGADARRIASRHLDALVGLAAGRGCELHLPSRVRATRRAGEIRLRRLT